MSRTNSRVIRHGTRFFMRIFTEWLRNKGVLASHARLPLPAATPAEAAVGKQDATRAASAATRN